MVKTYSRVMDTKSIGMRIAGRCDSVPPVESVPLVVRPAEGVGFVVIGGEWSNLRRIVRQWLVCGGCGVPVPIDAVAVD